MQFAVVAPAAVMILLGVIIGGLGSFRFQQVARLARGASRYASVHGTDYAADTGNPAATPATIYSQAILPYAAGMNPAALSSSVVWNSSNSPATTSTSNGSTVVVTNTVSVTVRYTWIPEAFFGGAVMTSTSVAVMSY